MICEASSDPVACSSAGSSPGERKPRLAHALSQPTSPAGGHAQAAAAPFGRPPTVIQNWTRQETRICKSLSYVLRHGALLKGLNMRADGYVKVADLLRLPEFRSLGFQTLIYIVKWNMKRRFSLAYQMSEDSEDLMDINPESLLSSSSSSSSEGGEPIEEAWLARCDPTRLYIRALQGHSIAIIDKSSLYQRVEDASSIQTCVHGTYWDAWDRILREGLLRMSRLHIHFARGLPGDPAVLSGIRQNAQLAIYVDVGRAMCDGIEFWTSHNGVILSEGINGALPSRYFAKVLTLPHKLPVPLLPLANEETQEVYRQQKTLLVATAARRTCSDTPIV
eukprot:Protomagalhaensia_wolfi_Nauph_80__72@NODE_1043_length_1777_cov_23_578251_g788_i0_p1_GENE_NODE_1043_length_1777_cov_23_578251_g788_i0NODE_1043_length_1777_cov_23_578251_g788_i0_p1_ORF_typecomplete_len335_score41_66PTS_2RNA/PF01885_16/1_2e59_NODE_1043_length_1777_cov_23_578251_g788_i07161720